MKTKQTLTITTLGLLALFLCGIVFYLSCKQEPNCYGCELTNGQLAFICYLGGQKVIFKNDTTNILDTLCVGAIDNYEANCEDPCNGTGSINAFCTFSHLGLFKIVISATDQFPFIEFNGNSYPDFYKFSLNVTTQTIIENSATYNDVYSVQVDSTIIRTKGDQLKVPWKIYYSKSKGFVRFYMLNGQTWSKL